MKIYNVTHMQRGWTSGGYPTETIVANSKEEAVDKALEMNKYWERKNTYASEFKIDGYVIEVYDEKTYNRNKKLSTL